MISKFALLESISKLPRKRLNGIYYHGWSFYDDDDDFNLWEEFDMGYSDYSALWITEEETIAEEFSDWKGGDVRIVYQLHVKTSGVADISYNESQDLIEDFGLTDFREIIDILMRYGYRGWITPGSIDTHTYDDIALFYPDEQVKIKAVKLFIDDDWTDFMKMSEAQELLNSKFSVQS